MVFCKARVNALLSFITEKTSEVSFCATYEKAVDMTYDPAQNPRKRHRGPDPKERYKGVYMAVLNKLIDQITTGFANIENQGFLQLLNSASFQGMSDTFPTEAFDCSLKGYGQLFESDRLKAAFQVLYSDRDFHTGKDKLCDFIAFYEMKSLHLLS